MWQSIYCSFNIHHESSRTLGSLEVTQDPMTSPGSWIGIDRAWDTSETCGSLALCSTVVLTEATCSKWHGFKWRNLPQYRSLNN